MTKTVNVAMIGYKFMGRAHSNAYRQIRYMMPADVMPVMKLLVGRTEGSLKQAAYDLGWQEICTDWREAIKRPDIDVVDICTQNYAHKEIAIEAAKAGKAVICEKPLAMNFSDAKEILKAAEDAKVKNMVCFSYRGVPAVALAKRMIDKGLIGKIFHWRSAYLQDWIIDPEFPLAWRLNKAEAGSGSHGDLNAHTIDLANWMIGDIDEVSSSMKTFVTERPVQSETTGGLSAAGVSTGEKGIVDVDDAIISLAHFKNGAIGTFEATRFAAGRKNGWYFEINGDKGSLRFDFERMNELQYFNREDPDFAQGFRNILVTEGVHPYIEKGAWWPAGHIVGYEHSFTHMIHDFMQSIANNTGANPSFRDGAKVNAVLEAMEQSSIERSWKSVDSI